MHSDEMVRDLYHRLLTAWNDQHARGMADLFAEDGELIGFDGSQAIGPEDIFSHLDPIFRDHPTARFVSIVKHVRFPGPETAVLRAIAGMVPRGKTDINPAANAHQTLVLAKRGESWRILLFQNTPAQFHGRPELVERMTAELKASLSHSGS